MAPPGVLVRVGAMTTDRVWGCKLWASCGAPAQDPPTERPPQGVGDGHSWCGATAAAAVASTPQEAGSGKPSLVQGYLKCL
jgi:hypothetical protein